MDPTPAVCRPIASGIQRRVRTHQQPAGRILLLYAACLALMLVAALAIATMRNAPSAEAEAGIPSPPVSQPVRATAR